MKTVNLINEKNNASSKVNKILKDYVISKTTVGGLELEKNERGEHYVHIANDENTGTPIYAKVDVQISLQDMPNRERTVKEKTKKDVEKVDLTGLFD